MKRNPAGYQQNIKRHTRHTLEGNGILANGPAKNRRGVGKKGRLKGRGKLNSR
jgi:hypothetical protein